MEVFRAILAHWPAILGGLLATVASVLLLSDQNRAAREAESDNRFRTLLDQAANQSSSVVVNLGRSYSDTSRTTFGLLKVLESRISDLESRFSAMGSPSVSVGMEPTSDKLRLTQKLIGALPVALDEAAQGAKTFSTQMAEASTNAQDLFEQIDQMVADHYAQSKASIRNRKAVARIATILAIAGTILPLVDAMMQAGAGS